VLKKRITGSRPGGTIGNIESGGHPLPLLSGTIHLIEGLTGDTLSKIAHTGLKEAINEILNLSLAEQKNHLLIVESAIDYVDSIRRLKLKTEQAYKIPVEIDSSESENGITMVTFLGPDNAVIANLTIADSSSKTNILEKNWRPEDIMVGNASVRGFVQLPTGTGKTAIFSKVIEQYLLNNPNRAEEHEPLEKGRKVLVAVHTQTFRNQTINRIDEFTERLKVMGSPPQKGENIDDVAVVVACYQSMTSRPEEFYKLGFDLVILDEAHQVLGPERSRVIVGSEGQSDNVTMDELKTSLSTLANSCTAIIGFTATPSYREKTI